MKQKDKKKLFLVFGVILLLACYQDFTDKPMTEKGYLERADVGEDDTKVRLIVDIGSIVEDYVLEMEIAPVEIEEQEARRLLQEAKEYIDADFMERGSVLPMKDSYVSELVEAEWKFSPEEYVQRDGRLILEKLPEEGVLIQVEVSLSCGEYTEEYIFPVFVERTQISKEELLLAELKSLINKQVEDTKNKNIVLPSSVDGETVVWSEEKEYLVIKILLLEILAYVLLQIAQKKEAEREEKKRKQEIELSYSEVVGQLTILLQAGMTMRQAWQKIAQQTLEKKEKGKEQSPIVDALLHLNQRLRDGEKERIAYERFAMELDVVCYRRLVRVLIGNLEKGTGDIGAYLEEESKKAYEERVLLAKKLGEEASTKMLFPLMLMMLLVMGIVMAPAIIRFSL